MRPVLLFFWICLWMSVSLSAQQPTRFILTHETQKKLPHFDGGLQKKHFKNTQETALGNSSNNVAASGIPVLPIVFHILYRDEVEYISSEQVVAQIDALNRDFGALQIPEPSGNKYAAVISTGPILSFCSAGLDINGLLTSGINYHHTSRNDWSNDNEIKFSNKGGANAWDTEHYINVWVADLADTIAGYGQMPGGPSETDGIVIDYRFLGTGGATVPPYDQGKTLTHLMGNYLNLYSLWGPDYCIDDEVWDTPIHNAPNIGSPGKGHISLCSGYVLEMTCNFMDFTDDSARFMFTKGQRERMLATISPEAPRAALTQTPTICNNMLANLGVADRVSSGEKIYPSNANVLIYPNPVKNTMHIQVLGGEAEAKYHLRIYSAMGALVYQAHEIPEQFDIRGIQWSDGLYLVSLSSQGEKVCFKSVEVTADR